MKREGDTVIAILTLAAIILAVVLVVKGVEKLLGSGEPATASECVTEYVLGDPRDLAAYILGDTAEDFVAYWLMQDGLFLVALNDSLVYRWAVCPTSQTELTWTMVGKPVPVVQSETR